MATHDFDSAEGLVNRVVCLRDGRTREIGGDGRLRERYRAAMAEEWP